MTAQLAIAPGSWGVEPPGDPSAPPRELVLDEIEEAGYRRIELGPVGYLPESPAALRAALGSRDLELVGGYAMEPFHRATERESILAVVDRTCRAIHGGGGALLVLIEALVPERSHTIGRAAEARRPDADQWRTLVQTIKQTVDLASAFGIASTFHPHAGTVVEFRDEVDRLMDALDRDRIGLCVDTGHSTIAGIDPVELIGSYGDRVNHVHLKDVDKAVLADVRSRGATFEEAVELGVFCRLGDGCVDFEAVARALDAVGFAGSATVEQDRLPGDPRALSDARHSLLHARGAGFAVDPAG